MRALVGLGHVGLDGSQGRQEARRWRGARGPASRRRAGAAARAGSWPAYGRQRRPRGWLPASSTAATSSGSARIRRDEAGQVGEATGADGEAGGVRGDVLELVRLVDDHDVVLRQDHPARADVDAVEVGVDHDDVGRRGLPPRRLGEARLAERAAGGAGALLAGDADRGPGPVARVPRPAPPGRRWWWTRPRSPAARTSCRAGRQQVVQLQLAGAPGRGTPAPAGGRGSCSAPSARPTRSPHPGARPGRAGPWWPAGPAGPWWRWRPRCAGRTAPRAPGRRGDLPVPVPACTTRWRPSSMARGRRLGHVRLARAGPRRGEGPPSPGRASAPSAATSAAVGRNGRGDGSVAKRSSRSHPSGEPTRGCATVGEAGPTNPAAVTSLRGSRR